MLDRKWSRSAAAAALLTASYTMAFSREAAADTLGYASVGALIGDGFKDGVNLGFGARGGYTLPMNLYIGGTFVYHLGTSTSTPFGDISTHLMYFGAEGGYEIAAGPVIVRPYVGLGDAIASSSVPSICFSPTACTGATSQSEGRFAIWPGAAVLYPIDKFFVGGDARFLIVNDFNAFSIFATGGLKF